MTSNSERLEAHRRVLEQEVTSAWLELEKLIHAKYSVWSAPIGIDSVIVEVEKRLSDARAAYDEFVAQ